MSTGTPSPRARHHLTEYAAEAFGLGLFMLSACGFAVLLYHPASPASGWPVPPFWRGALMGLAMGLTAVLNIYSPWGRRSGAHLNPAVTLAFWRLGKVRGADVPGYIVAQLAGGLAGVAVALLLLGQRVADPAVNYVVTVPGPWGLGAALAAELALSFTLLFLVLWISSSARWARYTGVVAGLLVALFITFEAPVSGMSINPARTIASAAWSPGMEPLWPYFVAPVTGMAVAAWCFTRLAARRAAFCAKLDHDPRYRCIFCGAGSH